MNGIGKQAAFYRGYLPDGRSLFPLTVLLSTTVGLGLLVCLISVKGDAPQAVTSFDSQCSERPEREVTKPSPTPAEPSSPSIRPPNAPHTSKTQRNRQARHHRDVDERAR
jgi:hypothetical protein